MDEFGNYVFKGKSEKFRPHKRRQTDEVWILSVEGTQLSQIPLLEDTTSLCMVTDVVPATKPPMLKLEIKEFNMPR